MLLVAIGGVGVYLDRSLHRTAALVDYPGRIGDTPGTNWLIVGSDSRVGLTPEQQQTLDTGGDNASTGLSDTIMILHIAKSGPNTLVSIPRDSYVPIPGHGRDKINAAFAIGGPALLAQTVEEATGLHLDHYAEIGFGGFAGVVDALGGITMCLDQPINDAAHGIVLPAGCSKFNGGQALGYVRERYALPLSDLDRQNNQRNFMEAVMSKATSAGTLANPFRLWSFINRVAGSLTVDNGDHIWNLAAMAWALHGKLVSTTVPVGGFENTDSSGNVLLWDHDKASRFFGALAQDQQIPADLVAKD
ncbi:LCP family protein [Speluncibacter jeojiensis]|uniref:LCP family protein n=1 Tax=Speluncibacter jeojiensis TaxID=2710754 RepID=A0A9X4LXJ6_9ACTN|nr:LCP family protein [Corynebacteriales bacterium D3-21]